MAHHHLNPRKVDADAHHRRRVAVPQHVRREVRQAEPGLPQVEDARRQPALPAADERIVGALAGHESLDRRAQCGWDGLVSVVGLPVDEQRRRVAVLHVVAHAQPAKLGEAQAGEEQQQHDVGVQSSLRHAAAFDAAHDGQHIVARERFVAAGAHARRADGRQRVSVDVAARDGQPEQPAGYLQFLAVERLRLDLALASGDVGHQVPVLDLVQRPVVAPHGAETGEILAVVVDGIRPRARLAQVLEQQRASCGHGQDRRRLVAAPAVQVVEPGRVGAGLFSCPERRPVVAPSVHPNHGTESAPVPANVAGEFRAGFFHVGRVPTMGAKEQGNATESVDPVAKSMEWGGGRDGKTQGASRLHHADGREGIRSPLTGASERDRDGMGANVGAIPYPTRAVGKFGVIGIVPPPPRTSWGLTEAETAEGYARCASGCSAPVVVCVDGEWLCSVCAEAMQVAWGVA